MSRFTGLEKIEQRTAAATEKAIVQLLKPYRPHALTITFDNGKEFTKHEGIARQLQTEVYKLREAEVLLSQDKTVSEVVRQLGVSEQTYYRWEKEYGGLDKTQARKLKALEKENLQLKTLVADLSLDNAILKEVLSK